MQANAVEQLGLIGGHDLCQAQQLCLLSISRGLQGLRLLGHGLQNGHALQLRGHVL